MILATVSYWSCFCWLYVVYSPWMYIHFPVWRHLVLTASSKSSSTVFSFLSPEPSAHRQVAVETIEELTPRLPYGVFQKPTARCAPAASTQVHEGSPSSSSLKLRTKPMGLKGRFLFLVAFASFPFGGSLAIASGPFLLAFSLRLEEEKGNFLTWVDRCVSHCWEGLSSLLGKEGKTKLSLVYKCSLYRSGFPGGSDGSAGDLALIPGSGRSPGEGNGNPLQYSCLENSMDGGAW